MPVYERVMGLGDWSLTLRQETPPSVLTTISTPFSQIVVVPARLQNPAQHTDTLMLPLARFMGAVLRPGPQRQIGGAGLAWYLGDDHGGAGVLETAVTYTSATLLGTALGTLLSGTGFSAGSTGAVNVRTNSYQFLTRREVLNIFAQELDYEWRIRYNAGFVVDVNTVTSLYGATPTGVIVRRDGGREAAGISGINGQVVSTWDWEQFGSKAYVFGKQGYGSSGGVSIYRGPTGVLLTIVRAFEEQDAPAGSEATVAAWWASRINRTVRTVDVSTTDYAVTGTVPVGGNIYLYDHEQGLYNLANPIQYQGRTIYPVSARVVGVSWPVEKGMGVYHRAHNGTSAIYTDLSDYVEWESPGARFEVSTAAQSLAPPSQAPPLASFFSSWARYAAEWRATTTNPVIGNGTIAVSFRRLGTKLEINGKITAGSTTTYGAGEYRITLPPNCTSTAALGQQLGDLLMVDSSAGTAVQGSVWVEQSATEMRCVYWPTATTTGSVTPTAPFTWANTDYLSFNIALELAP